MARYTESVCRLCRREGTKLFLKGDRCYSEKCAFTKRPTPPGMHARSRRRASEYGMQLREKQKVRRTYGLLEKQFAQTFDQASKLRGVPTGEALLVLLEMRLDNVAYRMGIGSSRPMARQMVLHGHVNVNGKRVDIPSYRVKPGDVITVREDSRSIEFFKALREAGNRAVPKWMDWNPDTLEGHILQRPERADIDPNFSEHLIVEYYSKL